MNQIIPHLFLGNKPAALNLEMLKQYSITHIVNAANEITNFFPNDIQYYNCHLKDDMTEIVNFDGPHSFIHDAIVTNTNVLVHCLAGASRSATIVIGFLMKYTFIDLQTAFTITKQCRSCVNPNPNYMRQLMQLDISLHGKSSFDFNLYCANRLCPLLRFLEFDDIMEIVRETGGDFYLALAKGLEKGAFLFAAPSPSYPSSTSLTKAPQQNV
jgi:protein-tyrosine phosphatase